MSDPHREPSAWRDAVGLVISAVLCVGVFVTILVLAVLFVDNHPNVRRMPHDLLGYILVFGVSGTVTLTIIAFHLGRRHARRRRERSGK